MNLRPDLPEVINPELAMSLSFVKRFWSSRLPRVDRPPRRAGIALNLEALESRWLPNGTVIAVTTAADDPTASLAGQTTLRDAINQANQTPGTTIVFAPGLAGQTLQPTAALPAITGAGTTINGMGMNVTLNGLKVPTTYSGPAPGNPGQVEPDYIVRNTPNGLVVAASNVTIEGMTIVDWKGFGIEVESGTTPASNTTISSNNISYNGGGIRLFASNTNILGNTISGNSWDGVEIDGSQNVVKGNIITGNSANGVYVDSGSQETIQGNTISGNGGSSIFLGQSANNAPPTPALSASPHSSIQAAVTLFLDGAEMLSDQLAAYAKPNLADVNASIAANSPYAGPYAELFVLAGEMAMAEQLSATK